ncbi:fatty acid desaturase [Mangrovitalea sediminis]|uniref:fatty acid desaturase n=1 Tax=Mangrovitalea sediminis TaxID=1982043 RepID=UPI000BE5F045|nr:fatty acid desaturase [Mangrovitalea sediminis]
MSDRHTLENNKRQIIDRFSQKSDITAFSQLALTLIPYGIFWYLAIVSWPVSGLLTLLCGVFITLFLLRIFVLMHECGHNALFATCRYNKIAGFLLGVLCGMPQYVWSKNHDFHHANNGNWERYRGPLGTLTREEYTALSPRKQRLYHMTRNIFFAPVGGFLYLIFNPRYTWIKGSILLWSSVLKQKMATPGLPVASIIRDFKCRYWKNEKEYWHMTGNNIVLLSLWALMSIAVGPALFFTIYLLTLSIAGAGGIILFAVQHNFEGSWAADDKNWCYHRAAVEGTSFLLLPTWLNWFTANIAYHHIHHLSARIPNYRLAACHQEYEYLFADVTRIKLRHIPAALKNNIWDVDHQRITTI